MRAVCSLPGDGTIELRARSGSLITSSFPELHALADALPGTPAVLDGEIVVLDESGRPDFQRLQPRMSASSAKALRLATQNTVHLVLFDVMYLGDRQDLTRRPYTDQRQALEDLALHGPRWSTPAAVVGQVREAFEATRELDLEGLVLKRLTSRYEPGRSRTWIKQRHVRVADCVIGGWVPGRGSRTGLPGAVLVGEPQPDDRLRYAGSVGTGWSRHERADLAQLLDIAAADLCPFTTVRSIAGARWVLPRLVVEIRYATRTRAGLLRHPSWHRLRPDLATGLRVGRCCRPL